MKTLRNLGWVEMHTNKKTMLSAFIKGPRDIQVSQVPVPEIGPSDALLKINSCFVLFRTFGKITIISVICIILSVLLYCIIVSIYKRW